MTKKAALSDILRYLNSIGDVEGSAIITRDGLLIVSEMTDSIDSETFAAMSATMFGAAETALMELDRGIVERVMVESKEAKIVAMGAGSNAILVVMVSPRSNLGLIFVEAKKAAAKIEKLMK